MYSLYLRVRKMEAGPYKASINSTDSIRPQARPELAVVLLANYYEMNGEAVS